jgi:hypothetical protein
VSHEIPGVKEQVVEIEIAGFALGVLVCFEYFPKLVAQVRGKIGIGILGEKFYGILELRPCLSRWSTLAELGIAKRLPDADDLAFGVVEVEHAGRLGPLQTFDDID